MKIPPETREKIMRMQEMQQQVQNYLMQKQQIQIQKIEVENALKELEKGNNNEVYEIVGTIMLKKESEELQKTLNEKKGLYELRLKTITKQIDKLTEESKKLQEKLLKEMKK